MVVENDCLKSVEALADYNRMWSNKRRILVNATLLKIY